MFTIAPSPQDINTIWAGSDDGLVHVTRNGGKNWDNVTPKDLPEFARISLIEASPHTNGTAYVAANRYQMDDTKPYVYKTTDFGKTWTKIVNGVKDTHFARQIREDTEATGLLYLGTENGIYVSFDDGANWQSLQLNLPDTSDPRHPGRRTRSGHRARTAAASSARQHRRAAAGDAGDHDRERCTCSSRSIRMRGLDRNVAIDYYLKNDADDGEDRVPRRAGHRRSARSRATPRPRRRRRQRRRRRRLRRRRRRASASRRA